MIPGPINDFIRTTEFQTGLALGVGLTALVIVATATRRDRHVVPIGGLVLTFGFVVGLAANVELPIRVALGCTLLAAGGFVAKGFISGRFSDALLGASFAAPGALLLATASGTPHAVWVAPLTFIAIIVCAPLVAEFDHAYRSRGWPLVCYAVSVVGVYFAVPNTHHALVLLGVALPLVFLGWPVPLASLGAGGSYAAVGCLVWIGAYESRGRDSALIGAIGCLGLLIAEPSARFLRRGGTTFLDGMKRTGWAAVGVAALQLAIVFIASRVAGVRDAVGPAVIVASLDLGAATVALWLLDPPSVRPPQSGGAPSTT